ncbi:anaerobic dehydrogenase, typically selenocysteine-containing [Synechococcus sp. PCC 7502]|uniref:molybdopterin oxidoreductase family protein n=1 Tax=Synechococcus sp. PCC 7502 TaxID=1173263 RepID=UPI00029FE6F2|nr:anaerobic dehydrogenase, typically selenocysteine-containing [Synechococcus sp. PCC 7502]
MSNITKTLCPYCGVGCGLEVVHLTQKDTEKDIELQNSAHRGIDNPVVNSKVNSLDQPKIKCQESNRFLVDLVKVRGDRTHPSSQGMVCVKGATIAESIDRDRLTYPMMRSSLDQDFQRVSWEEVLTAICDRITTVLNTQGADGLCMYGSGQFQTEDYYIAQKLFKGCLGTNNFDANSRLCMSSAVSGYVKSFGADGPPCCYEDLDLTDCAFIIGSNTAECHPIIFNRLRKHHKQNPDVKLIVVDPRRTQTAEVADLHLAIRPGTDIDLLNGIAYLILNQKENYHAVDHEFIQNHTNHYGEFIALISHYPPDIVADRCGISIADLETAARFWAESQRVLSLWSMGVNQSTEGTAKVQSIINLHLLTGQIGKPGAGAFSLTGQPNAMGGREAGGLSHLLPGYRFVANPQHRAELEQHWQLPTGQISDRTGRTAWDMIRGLESEEVGFLWIAATNPAVSFPDLERTKQALNRSPFTVYQDAYYPTETSAFAHLLLPATQWSEKTGTMTNSERRITLCEAFHEPLGEARDDWQIFAEVGRRLGFTKHFNFKDSSEVYAEFAAITSDRPCDLTKINHDLLKTGAVQWGGLRLYTDLKFHTANGKANFAPYHSKGLAEPPDQNYPFVLTIGRVYGHWHTMTRTGRIKKINQMHPHPFLEIYPKDAKKYNLSQGDLVEVKSRRGIAKFPALITEAIAPGVLFAPMHWGSLWADNAEANNLSHPEADPYSFQPELKACAVQIIKL